MTIHKCVLLVETDGEIVRAASEAFGALRDACVVHVLGTAAEAISYLMGIGKYGQRGEFPLPALVILGLRGAAADFAVVNWIRGRRALGPVRIVVLAEERAEEVARCAYEAGVNSFVVQPKETTALGEMLHALAKYWMECNQAPTARR